MFPFRYDPSTWLLSFENAVCCCLHEVTVFACTDEPTQVWTDLDGLEEYDFEIFRTAMLDLFHASVVVVLSSGHWQLIEYCIYVDILTLNFTAETIMAEVLVRDAWEGTLTVHNAPF